MPQTRVLEVLMVRLRVAVHCLTGLKQLDLVTKNPTREVACRRMLDGQTLAECGLRVQRGASAQSRGLSLGQGTPVQVGLRRLTQAVLPTLVGQKPA